MFGLFLPTSKKAMVFAVDTVRSNQMPNLNTMYANEHKLALERIEGKDVDEPNPPDSGYNFEVRVETELRQVFRQIQKFLTGYKQEKKGPTVIIVQSGMDVPVRSKWL